MDAEAWQIITECKQTVLEEKRVSGAGTSGTGAMSACTCHNAANESYAAMRVTLLHMSSPACCLLPTFRFARLCIAARCAALQIKSTRTTNTGCAAGALEEGDGAAID